MCGRSSLTKTEKELEQRFNASFYSDELERYNPLPNFNVAPSQMHPLITNDDQDRFQLFRWGLIPFWAKDLRIGYKMINARKETLTEKPSFKRAFKSRRCIVPFDGYYEWKKEGKEKQPYRIVTTNIDVFTIAGLWENWTDPEGKIIHSFTLITQPASPSIAHIHDRMPAILSPEQERLWLDTELPPQDALDLISPYPDDWIDFYPVSKRVGKVSENDRELIEPITLPGPTTLF